LPVSYQILASGKPIDSMELRHFLALALSGACLFLLTVSAIGQEIHARAPD
jgi:hypothetical protein